MEDMMEGKDKRNKSNEAVVLRMKHKDEEGRHRVEKAELKTHNPETIKYVEKKLCDKGVHRLDRHPVHRLPVTQGPPKSGHGGKYTWEGPGDSVENELDIPPAAIDEKDPNYVDEEKEEEIVRGEDEETAGLVAGEVEVAKAEEDRMGSGVARLEVRLPEGA